MAAGRIEYKYLAPMSRIDEIRADIMPYLVPDPFSEAAMGGEYTVRSIYYDTRDFTCYQEKDAGVMIRNKFRIRGYGIPNDDSLAFLEIKKRCDCVIAKNRAPLRVRDLEAFFADPDIDRYILPLGNTHRSRDDARRFLYYYYRMALRPAVLVVYDREAFSGRFNPSLRVTFDKRLRGRLAPRLHELHDRDRLTAVMQDSFVFEIKFFRRSLPQWAADVILRYQLPRLALSKYTNCLDLRHAFPRAAQAPRVMPAAQRSLV
jgi:hypothetical protein